MAQAKSELDSSLSLLGEDEEELKKTLGSISRGDVDSSLVEKLELLNEWYKKMATYYEEIRETYEKEGKGAAYCFQQRVRRNIGKKPTDVTFTIEGVKQIKEEKAEAPRKLESLKGLDLLKELENYVVKEPKAYRFLVAEYDATESNTTKIADHVKVGKLIVDAKSAHVLKDYMNIGLWLEKLFNVDSEVYKAVVKDHCNFGESWAKKLRSFSRIWVKYRGLQGLALNISLAVKISKNVDSALSTNLKVSCRWN